MAVKLGDGGDEIAEIADINVTPFIDVTLVLIIIFMVAAPLSTVDVAVDLPPCSRSLALGEDPVSRNALGPRLDAATGGDHDRRLFLRADKGVAYGDLMAVMNLLRDAGYLKIALVGLEDTGAPSGPAGSPLQP